MPLFFGLWGKENWGQRNESRAEKEMKGEGGGMSPKWRYKAGFKQKGKVCNGEKRKGAEGC